MLGTERLEIAGLLKYDPFRSDGLTGGQLTLIVSDETFARLTGITDYALLMIKLRQMCRTKQWRPSASWRRKTDGL